MKTKFNLTLSAADAKGVDQKLNNRICPRWFALALGGFLFTSLFALSALPVEAQCQQWSVGHGWRFIQGTTNVDMNLQQNGTVITGKATHLIREASSGGGALAKKYYDLMRHNGDVDGTLEGDSFAVRIHWDNNTTGVYNGTIGPSGRIEGKGYEQASPRTKVRWYSETRMVCADATAVEPTNPAPPPLKSTGKVPVSTPPPLKSTGKIPKTQSSAAATPMIKVFPVAIAIPDGQSEGTITLTWDGGPNHPDAEVWMRKAGQEAVRVAEDGKGTRPLKVERGSTYRFTLIDGGEELAAVAAISKR